MRVSEMKKMFEKLENIEAETKSMIEIRSVERKCGSETCASCWSKTCEILKKYKSDEVIHD